MDGGLPFGVSLSEHVTSLDEWSNELSVTESLNAGVSRVHRMLHSSLPIRVLVDDLKKKKIFFYIVNTYNYFKIQSSAEIKTHFFYHIVIITTL